MTVAAVSPSGWTQGRDADYQFVFAVPSGTGKGVRNGQGFLSLFSRSQPKLANLPGQHLTAEAPIGGVVGFDRREAATDP